MQLWIQIVLDWLNCLDVFETSIKDLKELEDDKYYTKLIELLSQKDAKNIATTENIVTKFLQDEYPEFKFIDKPLGEIEQVYVASLFLLRASQETLFHQPMCNKLQYETQVKIKTYLEILIPYGKSLNKEILKRAINELDMPSTPGTPRTQSLKNFFESPISQSTQIYKQFQHELRKLKAELEVERFEKVDLQEDLRIEQKKIETLQRKLEEKSAKIRIMREERIRPITPGSCKKNKTTVDNKQQYEKEIVYLEDQLTRKECEIDKVEADNGALSKKLSCMEKQLVCLKEKLDSSEKSCESLQIQREIKERELTNLRFTNGELRTHLRELDQMGVQEQSFEMDGIAPLNVTVSPMDDSEILSSVIDIQLQEAKEEAASLKIQLDTVTQQFKSKSDKYETVTQLFKEKTAIVESLKEREELLISENKSLKDSYNAQKERLLQVEESRNSLNVEIETLRETLRNVEESLRDKNESNLKINREYKEAESSLRKHGERIERLQDQNDLYKTSIDANNAKLKDIVRSNLGNSEHNDLDDATTSQLVEHFQLILLNLDKTCASKEIELKSLNMEVEDMKLKEQATELKHQRVTEDLQEELSNTKKKLTESVEKLEKLEETKDTLEKHRKNLKSQNEKILKDLNDINDAVKLSQQEASNTTNELKIKDERIGNLIKELTCLKLEKEHVVHLQMEGESKMKNIVRELETKLLEKQQCLDRLNTEAKLKQETLNLLQDKLEKLEKSSKEAIVSEMKMKEVIVNLQSVRTTQDSVLTTQENALKEKDLQIQQLQAEFNESKSAFDKQLQEDKLLKSTNSELQIKWYKKQTKAMEALQELLKRKTQELDESKERFRIEETKKFEVAHICEQLKQSVKNLKLTITEASPKNEHFYVHFTHNVQCTDDDDKIMNIFKTIENSINEMHASRKLILHLSCMNVSLNETLQNHKAIVDDYDAKCEEIKSLNNRLQKLTNEKEHYVQYLNNFISYKESLRNSLKDVIKPREDLDVSLQKLKEKWDTLLMKSQDIFATEESVCDELKDLQGKKIELEKAFFEYNIRYLENLKPVQTILWEKFLWTEENLKNASYFGSTNDSEQSSITLSNGFANEKTAIEEELRKNKFLKEDIVRSSNQVDEFSNSVVSLMLDLKETKFRSKIEKKLQLQINELIEEKNNLKSKLECVHLTNEELESRVNEFTSKIKELEASSLKGEEHLKEIIQLKEENSSLLRDRNELNKRPTKEDVDNQLKDMYDKYKCKLDEIKQNMKTAYNEQITKLNREQEQCVQNELELLQRKMELQCRKQADELSKYKAHVADMSSQIWNVGEKLLSEQQEKEKLQTKLNELKAKYRLFDQQILTSMERKSSKYERRDLLTDKNKEVLRKVAVIQERTTYERCSIKSLQRMGNAFDAEDEEGEVFNNTYLADMKDGHSSFNTDTDRLSVLQKRNALCMPHLKSAYFAEMQFYPFPLTEEEIKSGTTSDEAFNDSLSQSLLPEQKVNKKKDKTQMSYKKCDPPTPSKNGGRLSIQGNHSKSPNSRILKERNKDKAAMTPRMLKAVFSSKRQDEVRQKNAEEAAFSSANIVQMTDKNNRGSNSRSI